MSESHKTNWIDRLVAHIASKANKQQYIISIDRCRLSYKHMHFSKFVCVHAQINWEFLSLHEGGLTCLYGEQNGVRVSQSGLLPSSA